jgi:hypothetical protein
VRNFAVLIWTPGIPRPLVYTYLGVPKALAVRALRKGEAMALGPSDYVTAECEGWNDWDVTAAEIVWRWQDAQETAWDAWCDTASADALEIADTLTDDWTLGAAALADTAELLALQRRTPTSGIST